MTLKSPATGLVLLVLLGWSAGSVRAQDLVDKGVFKIYIKGQAMGQEDFDISLADGAGVLRTKTTLHVAKDGQSKDIKIETKLVLKRGLAAESYELVTESGAEKQSVKVSFKSDQALCEYDTGLEKTNQAVGVPSGTIILDDNIFAHWTLLLFRYDDARGGQQGYSVFVPQMGLNGQGPVTIEQLEKDSISVESRRVKAIHYKVSSSLLVVDIWRDNNGRVQKIAVPQNGAEVVRSQ